MGSLAQPAAVSRWSPIAATAPAGCPRRFSWRGRWYRVRHIHEQWQDQGAWWAEEAPHWFFRVEVEGGGIFELASDLDHRQWWLYRVYD